MRAALEAIDSAVCAAVRVLALLAGLVLLWLMFLTVAAAVMRKVMRSPILGVHDVSEVSLLVLVFLGMAYCGRTGGHIVVDLAAGLLPGSILRISDIIGRLSGGALLSFVAWHTVARAFDALAQHEASNLLFLPLYPFYLVVAAGFALYAVVLFLQALGATDTDRGNR